MKIYLDNCSFNRPFDDQTSIRIKIETEAKLFIQEQIVIGKLQLIWSYVLEYENMQNPFIERRNAIIEWKQTAVKNISGTEKIVMKASEISKIGLNPKDALHVACAIEGKAVYFLTTDDKILKKLAENNEIVVINPVNFISILESV